MAGTHGRQKPAVKKTTPNKKAASSSSKAKTLNKNLQRVADSETPSSPFSTPPTSPCPQGEDDCSSLINNTPVSAATLKARKKKALEFGPNFSPMWVNDNLTIKTNEEILDIQRAAWTSNVYQHFQKPVIIDKPTGVIYKFVCLKAPPTSTDSSQVRYRGREDRTTSNLKRHIEKCDGVTDDGTSSKITRFGFFSSYTEERLRYVIAKWFAARNRSFRMVDDPEFVQLVKMLNASAILPGQQSISRDLSSFHRISKGAVRSFLQSLPSKIHIGFDGWTSPHKISYIGLTVHFVKDGVMSMFTLDFIRVGGRHTGQVLANHIYEVLVEFGITDKILGAVCDNASNNDTLLAHLCSRIPSFRGENSRSRCFAHILNLVCKAILSVFNKKKNSPSDFAGTKESEGFEPWDDEDEDAMEEVELGEVEADEEALEDVAQKALEAEPLTSEQQEEAQFMITKLSSLAKKLIKSTTLSAAYDECQASNGLNVTTLPRDVVTRWNSTYAMLVAALEKRNAIDELTERRKNRVTTHKLSDAEWRIAEELNPILTGFDLITNRVSKSNIPLVHEVISYIDCLHEGLLQTTLNTTNHNAIRHAANRGIQLLNKYYSKTDDSDIYRIAILLHPAYKKQYLEDQGWEDEWITMAIDLLTRIWNRYYNPNPPAPEDEAKRSSDDNDDYGYNHHVKRYTTLQEVASAKQKEQGAAVRADVMTLFKLDGRITGTRRAEDQLAKYLREPPIADIEDPIEYYYSNSSRFPDLARFALDYLSIPAASVDTERGFKRGRLTATYLRQRLKDETTRAAVVWGQWATIPGLVPEADLIALLADKSSRQPGRVTEASLILGAETDQEAEPEEEDVEMEDCGGTSSGEQGEDDI